MYFNKIVCDKLKKFVGKTRQITWESIYQKDIARILKALGKKPQKTRQSAVAIIFQNRWYLHHP